MTTSLRHIADYLHGRTALSLSLTSKRVYDIAIPRVAAVIDCWSTGTLRALHHIMVRDNPLRARHIHNLVIRESAMTFEEFYGRDDEIFDGHDPKDLEPPVAPLIYELLMNAPNIRRLTIERFAALRRSDPRVVTAMASLPQLSRLELDGVPGDALANESVAGNVHRTSGRDLVTLSLNCSSWWYDDAYPPLFRTISAFPRLVSLKLRHFSPDRSCRGPHHTETLPLYPSIQQLFLEEPSAAALDLVTLFPNLSVVGTSIHDRRRDISDDRDHSWENREPIDTPWAGTTWGALRSVILSSELVMHRARDVINQAFHLRVDCTFAEDIDYSWTWPVELEPVLMILRKVSPVRAQLSVEVGVQPMRFWAGISEIAPRLRYLELKVTL
ncbi:hypothetical protein BD309DRAFT_43941 [Dichomitus squalens]|nr:hypothetical protein BD309DRAFT_43941 [Dichomitus squalens]